MSLPEEFLVTGKKRVGDKTSTTYAVGPKEFSSIYNIKVKMDAFHKSKVTPEKITDIIKVNPDLGVSSQPVITNDTVDMHIGSRDPKIKIEEIKDRVMNYLLYYTPLNDIKPDDIVVADEAKVAPKSISVDSPPGSKSIMPDIGGPPESAALVQSDQNKADTKPVSLIDDMLSGNTIKILKLRLAAGSISLEDFERIKKALQS